MAILTDFVDWNGRQCPAVTSRGGVISLINIKDNLMLGKWAIWPPSSILQKCYQSRQLRSFDDDEKQALLSSSLKYYCDLQSIHSEDAITWSFFGTLLAESQTSRLNVLNWFCDRLCLPLNNKYCEISLFQRIPHPDTLVSGGPELDVLLHGDACVIFVEAKWLSSESADQGKEKEKTQLQLRLEFLEEYGARLFGPDMKLVVLSIVLDKESVRDDLSSSSVVIKTMLWEELCQCTQHPLSAEFGTYYSWKLCHHLRRNIKHGNGR